MPIFKPRRHKVTYETESVLPGFRIDANGFIIFDNDDLGGCGIFEVTPQVMTTSLTHSDPVKTGISTESDDYISGTGSYYKNKRKETYPIWTEFLNNLHAKDEADDPIHIQIILKKVKTDEWDNRTEYAIYQSAKYYEKHKKETSEVQNACMMDYIALLSKKDEEINNAQNVFFDVRRLPSYKTKMFIIVSYTPSSEGWWINGRDSDYYVSDNWSPTSMFKEDKIVDNISDFIMRRNRKKEKVTETNTANDLFWIESDKTAQTIETRMQKIERNLQQLKTHHPQKDIPFSIKRLHERDAAAIIKFFPNILTPYMDKIYNLQTDYNELYYQLDAKTAIATGDVSFINDNIKNINAQPKNQKESQEEFLSKFKGITPKNLKGIQEEFEDRKWTAEQEIDEQEQEITQQTTTKEEKIWESFDPSYTLNEEKKTSKQIEEEFLNKFKTRSLTAEHSKINEEIEKQQKQQKQNKTD